VPLPLDGIRVVDFTAAAAGPCATMLLADFGAEVIKIEPPEGDQARHWGTKRLGPQGDMSGLFLAFNRNKSSVVLDLKTAHGKAVASDLLSTADVVVENFKPGVASRLGVGYEQVTKTNPNVIYCSISGFGQTGPMRDRPGFDYLLQAYAGHMSITGEKGRPSVRTGISANDILAGAHAAYGIVMALLHRERTGEGQQVDTSLYEVGLHLIAHYIADYTGTGELLEKSGSYFPFLAPYGVFRASDREFYLGCGTDRMYERFCIAVDRSDLASDARFTTNGKRVANSDALYEELGQLFATKTAKEWVSLFVEHDIPTTLLYNIAEVVNDQEQARARTMLVPVGIEGILTAGIPIKMSRTPGRIRLDPPSLGEQTNEILGATELAAEGPDE
jgi:crotonobetainyl-CoA:carnitine CoA-transferase CaiB-like acyl-CoA transferase